MGGGNNDWVPDGRQGLLDMAEAWMRFLTFNGARIGAPPEYIGGLNDRIVGLKNLLDQTPVGERTKAKTAQINLAAQSLEQHLRYGKKHWIIMPPVTLDEWVSMLLPAPDTKRTPVPGPVVIPVFQPVAGSPGLVRIVGIGVLEMPSWNKSQYHELILAFGLGGLPTEDRPFRFNKEPVSPDVLPHIEITKRREHTLTLTGESGNTLYIAARYRNVNGVLGPWSAIIKVIIP